jgi:hypothetical protein
MQMWIEGVILTIAGFGLGAFVGYEYGEKLFETRSPA